MISVAGWERQLNRARKHRRYVVPGTAAIRGEGPGGPHSVAGGPTGKQLGLGSGYAFANATNDGQPGGAAQEGFTGVATQMMDAADQRMPTLSVNARRKSFHALAVIMFIPGIAVDVSPLLFPFFCNLWNDDTRAKTRLVDIAGIHSSILLCRICRIQLCRIRPLFCPLAVWRQGSSLFERIPGSQGFWDSNLESFLFIGGVCCASMV